MPELSLHLILFFVSFAYNPGPRNMFFAAISRCFGFRTSVAEAVGHHAAQLKITMAIGLVFNVLASLRQVLIDLLCNADAAYVFLWPRGFPRAIGKQGEADARLATALDGAILLPLNRNACLTIALMMSRHANWPCHLSLDWLFACQGVVCEQSLIRGRSCSGRLTIIELTQARIVLRPWWRLARA